MNFDEIISLKNSENKTEKLKKWYTDDVKISKWLTNPHKNSIIKFHDRTEYKKNGKFHRLNGPAIEYQEYDGQTPEDKYYYKGELLNIEDWTAITRRELRKLKLKQLDKK
jgi:hypothetical protein